MTQRLCLYLFFQESILAQTDTHSVTFHNHQVGKAVGTIPIQKANTANDRLARGRMDLGT